MGPTNNNRKSIHRPGPLKQSNKEHKGGRSKVASKEDKGRVDVKSVTRNNRSIMNRQERKHQANQIRKNKREAILEKKRGGISSSPPLLVAIIALEQSINGYELLERLKNCDQGISSTVNEYGHCHINFPQQKQRFTFFIPKYDDLHAVMDAIKVVDTILFIHSTEVFDSYTEMLLSTILAHALPTTVHILPGLEGFNPKKKSEIKKDVLKKICSRFPNEKLLLADTEQELQLLLRQIGCQKCQPVTFRDNRPYLFAEAVEFESDDSNSDSCTLKVSGYIRGKPLNVNGLVHILGWGDFQMSQIVYEEDPHLVVTRKKDKNGDIGDSMVLIDKCDPAQQESLQSEIIPDISDSRNTLSLDDEEGNNIKVKKVISKVVKGTSEYQAAWIVESDEESCSEESDDEDKCEMDELVESGKSSDDEDMKSDSEDGNNEASELNEDSSKYDKDMDINEEQKMLVRFREERMEQMFPDERDTPADSPARLRYQKYRGLKNFAEAPWDPMQDLPLDYSRIYRFENFNLTKKKIFNTEREGCLPGLYVTLHIIEVPKSVYESISENVPFVVYGLLPHEQKMSVTNVVLKKHPSCKVPIKSKDSLIFHIGFRRFVCQPIFSQHSRGNKFKYETFMPGSDAVVASFYAPTIFPPASVVVFRQTPNGEHELVATGALLNAEPNRNVVKRIVLSGHPFKILKRSAVVRYMFFNKDDINWFKCIELRTKCGRKGHIKESLGSHGHMKCVFDQQLQSQDVIFMFLYKRVFPKWTYNPIVPTPISSYSQKADADETMLI